MDAYTAFRFNFTFDIWLESPSPDGVTSSEVFYKSSTGLFVPSTASVYLFTKEQIPINSIIKNFRDDSGNRVFEEFGEDVRRYVTAAEPTLNYSGVVNGYKHTLRRSLTPKRATPE